MAFRWLLYGYGEARSQADLRRNATVTLVIGQLLFGAITLCLLAATIFSLVRPETIYRDRNGQVFTRADLRSRFPEGYTIVRPPNGAPTADGELSEGIDHGPHWAHGLMTLWPLLLSWWLTFGIARELARRWRERPAARTA